MFSWMIFFGLMLFFVGRSMSTAFAKTIKEESAKKYRKTTSDKVVLVVIGLVCDLIAYGIMTIGVSMIISQI